MQVIGIDLGTTSICGVVMDADSGEVLRTVTRNSNAFISECREFERIQSVDKIVSAALEITREFLNEETAAIGVTGQMHGIVYVNRDGNAVSPLYTWQDGRGNLPFRNTTYAAYLGSFSGYGNVTDFYNRENGIRQSDAVSYCTIHDYFVMKLCGLSKPIIHTSDAASFGCFDLKSGAFSYDFEAQVTDKCCIAGEYRGIPVSVAIGDNQASVLSCISDSDVLINVGTGSQVSVISDVIRSGKDIETRPYFEGKYLTVGAALCGGRAYSMLKDFYSEILGYQKKPSDTEVYDIMSRMLEKCSVSSLTADTRFDGTRSDADITGGIYGITTDNFTPPNVTRAFLCGMVRELFDMYCAMNLTRSGLVGSGNGIRKNPYFVKIAEEAFGAKMKIPVHTEEASVGAALFAMTACGKYGSTEAARQIIKYINKGDSND